MSESNAFHHACEELERRTSLDRLEARGTVRLALRQAGLEARSVTPSQMAVVFRQLMPGELSTRGVSDAGAVCTAIGGSVETLPAESGAESPDAVFARLGGGSR